MCCGIKPRTNTSRVWPQTASRSIAGPLGTMPAAPAAKSAAAVQFEYVGKTRMTVVSPTTGIRYHFASPGARVAVDARDRQMMVHVPGLRPMRFLAAQEAAQKLEGGN